MMIMPPLIDLSTLPGLAEVPDVVLVKGSFGANLEWVDRASFFKLGGFAFACAALAAHWAVKPYDERPRVIISGHCIGGSLEAVLWAARSIEPGTSHRCGATSTATEDMDCRSVSTS